MVTIESTKPIAEARRCPSCGGARPVFLGALASEASDFGFSDGGALHECPECHLLFLSKAEQPQDLAQMYGDLPSDLLDELPGRKDFDLAALEIGRSGQPLRVLDVGCFRGDFLAVLPDGVEKFGIEPSQAAQRVAAARGIKVIGDALESTTVEGAKFDVIVMMDVLEHLPNPFAALKKLSRWLTPGGRMILTTGNSDALPWRLRRLCYYYYLPQHISFCNLRWFRWVAGRLQLDVAQVMQFSHSRRAYGKTFVADRWVQFGKCVAAWLLSGFGSNAPGRQVKGDATWPDHLMVILQSRS